CCCHRILFNEPDFLNVESLLETQCCECGFHMIFLPKFHCELNFIEMCWGYAKQIYQLNPPSSKEADLEQNVITALAAIPLTMIFAMHSWRFMAAYKCGLDGAQPAWAVKKYCGHCVLPETLMADLDKA
ncbi:hypothetical protein PAXRUDRAFT_53291, partial [Paxillus rubicundulus Ve08.2h10]